METRKSHRRLIIGVGLLASLITILAGGFRGQLINISDGSTKICSQNCTKSDCDHSEKDQAFLSAPSDAIPGSSSNATFDCPSCNDLKPEGAVPVEEKPNAIVRFVNHYFKTLVRSLIRTNAP